MDKYVIIDTDMASVFAKIERLELLKLLFSKYRIVITPRIHDELMVSLQFGYSFPNEIFKHFEVIYPTSEEGKDFQDLMSQMITPLGKGELEAISICKSRGCIFSSLDQIALRFAEDFGIETVGLHSILRAFWKSQLLSKTEVEAVIRDIEVKDNTKIKDKNAIFRD
ncbi:MAG: hypothetical protein EHM14_13675 [Methanothrix sp.]|nr:MAG: hypothetical protein EHM14_13675 [Methanothrix sp.]